MPPAKARSRARNTRPKQDSRARTAQRRSPAQRRGPAQDHSVWQVLLPLALGIAATFGTVRLAAILTFMGPQPFSLLYPWVALFSGHPVGLSYDNASALSQMLLYLQFPLYGLLAGIVLFATRRFWRAVTAIFAVHIFGILLVLLMSLLRGH
ncbi:MULTISPECIES: hypothetical protein [Acidobacterium]|uniref:Uncharacterized protein n=1 Tax=Acidobacterium capsulatum (strain ATCC 51196 / DSM 11244 / BCRC 80197 / JCM 7670 / NBRC 15755 / NCIMB 13165 / 161) TaxID=240015 RepID=C1F7A7_ACIC5|nr:MULTISPECIES: hypothetical protein [Acidobacterium]ACO31716.1 hypothetical protein ACP_1663 [Acidobacterium capsulatum ATCC 51196]HCT61042.1 hypothetical protein [Acidobacterium sp.]